MGEIIRISARLFDAAAICASTEDFRTTMRGVYVQPHPEGGAVLMSTDGHRFLVIRDEKGVCSDARLILADKALRRITKAVKGDEPLVVTSDGLVSVADNPPLVDLATPTEWVGWRRAFTPLLDLIKANGPAAHATFNPSYLGDFGKVGQRLNRGAYQGIRIIALSDSDPALILFPYIPNVFAVLMPMRGGNEKAFPAWLRPLMKTKRPARRKVAANDEAAPSKRRAA